MKYRTEIIEIDNKAASFLVTVTDEAGSLVGSFPATTLEDAEHRLLRVLDSLRRLDAKAGG
jgi:hypothetical protein